VTTWQIGFIGGGNMAGAIARGLAASGFAGNRLALADPDPVIRSGLAAALPDADIGADNAAVARGADVLVLAVKPQVLPTVARSLASVRPRAQLVISVAAGVRLASLAGWLGTDTPLVRAMPNQPALVGAGVTALAAGPALPAELRQRAGEVLAATGAVVWLPDESLMDAVTAVSGSGPAYFYLLVELMERAALELGLPAGLAATLARQTALGAGKTLIATGTDPAALRASVTSPGGTTAAAIAEFERAGLAAIVSRALTAARDRGVELGRPPA
jgi:pyrroline-5-carboxylate reductase